MVQKLSSNMQKPHEEYPLLKVESGAGDRAQSLPLVAQPAISVVTPNTRRQAFFTKWPEFLSACWLTLFIFLILFIAFLASCSMNLQTLKRKSINVSPCFPPRPVTEVFYHQVVEPDRKLPIRPYTDYLSLMAYLYPYLRFNVIFLINDKFSYQGSRFREARQGRFYNKLQPLMGSRWIMDVNDLNEHEIKLLQRFQNINVTVLHLSEFMAETPLKYRWKNVQMTYLHFYIRVYSVWKYGGIALDLVKYHNQYVYRRQDERISAIFKQFNDDISCNLEYEEDNDVVSMIQGVFRELFNQTQKLMNKTVQYVDNNSELEPDMPLIRTHRNKREISPEKEPTTTEKVSTNAKELPVNNTEKITAVTNANFSNTFADDNEAKILVQSDIFPLISGNDTNAVDKNESEYKTIIFYDIMTIYSGAMGPSHSVDSNIPKGRQKLSDKSAEKQILTLDMGGTFIATISRHHPFLAHIINLNCQRMAPGVAIEHALYNQCSGIFRSKYCDLIDILY